MFFLDCCVLRMRLPPGWSPTQPRGKTLTLSYHKEKLENDSSHSWLPGQPGTRHFSRCREGQRRCQGVEGCRKWHPECVLIQKELLFNWMFLSHKTLYSAGEKKWGTDEAKFIEILCRKSIPQIRQSAYSSRWTTQRLSFGDARSDLKVLLFSQPLLNTKTSVGKHCSKASRQRCLGIWEICW